MKRVLQISIALVFIFKIGTAGAQSLPGYSPKACSVAHTYISSYQQTANHHPSAFLMKASGVDDYFSSLSMADSAYMQIYFGSYSSSYNDIFLAAIGCKYNGITLVHDSAMNYVLATDKVDPNLCTIYDSNIDDTDTYDPQLCDINNCVNRTYSKSAMHNYITNYQMAHPKGPGPVSFTNSQSFLINATAIRDFLFNNASVKYLQFYLGKNSMLPNNDHLTLIVVGVDDNGNHVYYNGSCLVFDEVNPCPRCLVANDPALDYQAQN